MSIRIRMKRLVIVLWSGGIHWHSVEVFSIIPYLLMTLRKLMGILIVCDSSLLIMPIWILVGIVLPVAFVRRRLLIFIIVVVHVIYMFI